MINKNIEISREMAERIIKDGAISVAQIDQLRQKLSAPEAPRQELAGFEEWFRKEIGDPSARQFKGLESRDVYVARKAWNASKPAPLSPDHSGGGAGVVLSRYTCIGKGGEYELLGSAIGAGTLKDMSAIPVYRDITTGQLFVRTPLDFSTRMESLDKVKELNQ